MLGLRRDAVRQLQLCKILHYLLHLQLVDTFFPDRVPASQHVEHDNTGRPDVCLLRIGEDVGDLLWRLVEECTTFGEVRDLVE